ncbi:MAG TPA: ABC transporter permease [Candidatus Binatia bacterium]|nr:ABC transporter permease [Candidatus Binatia bacterium]
MDRRYWDLTLQLAVKDFKIRYTHSLLGYAWSVLNPLVFSLIYYLVFSVFVRFEVPNYPGYLLLGIVLWSFFAEGSSNGVVSLLARAGLLTKAALPRQLVVYAAVLNALMTFGISLLVLAVMLRVTGTTPSWSMLAFPVLLLDLVVLTLGVALLLAPLHVRYHDVGYLWGLTVQIGFWLTPVIYWERIVPDRWRWLMQYNPMARIIEHSRQAVLYETFPDWAAMLRTTIMAAFVLLAGTLVFRRLQARVVEYF